MGLVFWAPKLPLLKKLALLALRGFWLRSARGAGRSGFRLSPEALYITPCDPDPHPGAQEEARSGEWPSFTNFIYANPMRRHLPKDAAVISPQKIGLDARFFKRRVWPNVRHDAARTPDFPPSSFGAVVSALALDVPPSNLGTVVSASTLGSPPVSTAPTPDDSIWKLGLVRRASAGSGRAPIERYRIE